jgi:hypothetical protein
MWRLKSWLGGVIRKNFSFCQKRCWDNLAFLPCAEKSMIPLESQKDGKTSKWKTMINHNCFLPNGGLKRTGASYFALFRPVDDLQSKLIIVCGVVLAIVAGVPLPIIGVIFARIIDAFPPREDEVHQRISQLLGVGKC